MANRSGSRTYGSIDEQSRSSSERLSAQARESLLEKDGAATTEKSSIGRRSWLAVALVCAVGFGAIAATNRSSAATSSGEVTTVADASAPHETLAERLPQGTLRPAADSPHAGSHVVQKETPTVRDANEALAFTMTNFYMTRDGKPGQLIPWLQGVQLAEPHRETTLSVTNPREGYSYHWEVRQAEVDDVIASASGAETIILFPKLDWNVVTLEESDSTGTVTRSLSENVMVKYVRREIRTLTDDEREELLDAMAVLWNVRVKGGNGKEIYGKDYADIWAINRLHFSAAADYECDHFHDGLGFLTSHSLMTNTFEYSLQIVNPKLTVPYWDFTIESTTWGGNVEEVVEPQANSPMFHEDWFGYHDSDDYMLKDSRWARTAIPKVEINNPAHLYPDVYSKLRAPWNVNDRPYISRGMGEICGTRVEELYKWPNCEAHYDLNMLYDDFYSWVWTSLYDPHGPVHVWLGGVLDCTETYDKIADLTTREIAREMSYYSFVHRKNMWRGGYFRCESTAHVEDSPGKVLRESTCGCLDYNTKEGDDYLTIYPTMVFMSEFIGDYDADTKRAVIDTLCHGLSNDGDHLQASSSLDPSFWVTHPTMERLFMFKRLTGTMTDLSWPDSDVTVMDEETGTSSKEVLNLFDESCVGHRGSDVFPFDLAVDEGDEGFIVRTAIKGDEEGGNTLTNREVLLALDPRVNKLSYIYDNFEWVHCAEDGVDMNDVWPSSDAEKTKAAPKRPSFKEDEQRYPMFKLMRDKAAEAANRKSKAF